MWTCQKCGRQLQDKDEQCPDCTRTHQRKMPCPQCGRDMVSGHAAVHSQFWGFLFAGVSWQHCYFKPDTEESEQKVLHYCVPRPAFRCLQCGTVVLPGSAPT